MYENKKKTLKSISEANKGLPEVTTKSVVLGIVFAIVLAISSTYLGLKIGRTIAGSIPAALLSVFIFQNIRNSNILQNNMVQTIASAGESIAAVAVFTITSVVMLGYWDRFHYLETMLLIWISGTLGVLFSMPLRHMMIIQNKLPYPEGVVVAKILKSGEVKDNGMIYLLKGGAISIGVCLLQAAFKVMNETFHCWCKLGSMVVGFNASLSSVCVAVGYITKIKNSLVLFLGTMVGYLVILPMLIYSKDVVVQDDLVLTVDNFYRHYLRYIGIGALIVAGIYNLLSIIPYIFAIFTGRKDRKKQKSENEARFFSAKFISCSLVLSCILSYICINCLSDTPLYSTLKQPTFFIFLVLAIIIIGFMAAIIAANIVGVVGTTSLPASGISIGTMILFVSAFTLIFKDGDIGGIPSAALVLFFISIICTIAVMSGDNMQDLKAGHIVGATPWKQQVMLMIGVMVSALVVPYILQTLFETYGMGDVVPRPDMDKSATLAAVAGTLLSTLAKGFFAGDVQWDLISIGIIIGIASVAVDLLLKFFSAPFRIPSIILAVGIYLPLSITFSTFIGGIIHYLIHKKKHHTKNLEQEQEHGILFASGLITGESITGALLSIPFAIYKSTDLFAIHISEELKYYISLGIFVALCVYFYKIAEKGNNKSAAF